MTRRGFTLIELLVVIAIIGLLSSIVLASLNTARDRARDARRKSDVNTILTALALYQTANGNTIQAGSGCGYNGDGYGWFNAQGGSYPTSIAQCLINADYLQQEVIDPTGNRTSGTSGHAYMKYHCASGTYVYAGLASAPRFVDGPTNGTCCPDCDVSYGMNYWKRI